MIAKFGFGFGCKSVLYYSMPSLQTYVAWLLYFIIIVKTSKLSPNIMKHTQI